MKRDNQIYVVASFIRMAISGLNLLNLEAMFFLSELLVMESRSFIYVFLKNLNIVKSIISYLQGQVIQQNQKGGVIMSNSDLALQQITKNQAGNYTCVASNVEGDGDSNTVELKVMCK